MAGFATSRPVPRDLAAGRGAVRAPPRTPPREPRPEMARDAGRGPSASRFSIYVAHPLRQILPAAFALLVAAALLAGWWNREEEHITPDAGLGYWLGIAGSVLMLLLLVYPLRKRVKAMRALGSVAAWFRFHMILGVIGPALILFHSNFALGSLNSNVALFAMLIVAGSGVVGRYLYSKVHLGLHGRKAGIREILADIGVLKGMLGDDVDGQHWLASELAAFEQKILAPRRTALASFGVLLTAGSAASRARRRLVQRVKTEIGAEAKRQGWRRRERRVRLAAAEEHLAFYFGAVKKAAWFAFYERLFALWHVLHLPLFFLLVLTAIVHVVAVHLY